MVATYQEDANDFVVRYEGCYGVDESKVFQAINFNGTTSGDVNMTHSPIEFIKSTTPQGFLIENSYRPETYSSRLLEFNNDLFPIPKMGFINHDFYVLFYERKHKKPSPARYRRGLRLENVEIKNLSNFEISALGLINIKPDNFQVQLESSLKSLFFPKFFTYHEALEKVLSGERLSAAISPTLAIKVDGMYQSIVLMKNLWSIGDYCFKRKTFLLRTSIFNRSLDQFSIEYLN